MPAGSVRQEIVEFVEQAGLYFNGTLESLHVNIGRAFSFKARVGNDHIISGTITGVEIEIRRKLPVTRIEISNKRIAGLEIRHLEYKRGSQWYLVSEGLVHFPGLLSLAK